MIGGMKGLDGRAAPLRLSKKQLAEDAQRRERLEWAILEACRERPLRSQAVAAGTMRNLLDVRAVMLDLCHRGRLRTSDGYRTFQTVGEATS